ncbi:MAG: hypothetical protein K8J31_31580 [Anaerolineae bacterium]|nr:hypothetical protein [Anaerolineae bacterium]
MSEVVLDAVEGVRAENALGGSSAIDRTLSLRSRLNGRVLCFTNGQFFFTADFAGRLLLHCQTDVNGRLVLALDDKWLWNNQGEHRFTSTIPLSIIAIAQPTQEADLTALLTELLVIVEPTPLARVILASPTPSPTPTVTHTPTFGETLLTPGAIDASPALNPTPVPPAAGAGDAESFACEGGGTLKIAFDSNRSGTRQIYLANPDGSDVQRITYASEMVNAQPLWSPDGRHIAFLRQYDHFSVTVMDVVTGKVRQVTNAGAVNGWHAWSSDGQWLVFSGLDRRDIVDIYVVNVNDDPMTARKLTDGFVNLDAQWHPDGDRIVFSSRREDAPEAIFIMNADGSEMTRLAPDRTFYSDTQPQWSFDGQSLFFLSDDSANGTHDIYSMRGDGAVIAATVNVDDETEFQMSPAGMDMAYISVERNSMSQITSWDVVVWPEGAPARKVTNTREQEGRIAWSPDGTHIAYVVSTDFEKNDAPKRIDVLEVATGHITENVGGIGAQGIDDNPTLGCLPGDVVPVAEEGQGNDHSAEAGCDAFISGAADVIGWVAPDAPVVGQVSQGETVRLVSQSPWGLGTQSYWQLGNGGWIGSDAITIQQECLSLPMNYESTNPIEIVPPVEAGETAAPEPPEQEVTSCIVQTAFWYSSILPEPVRQDLPGEMPLILVAQTDVVHEGLPFWKLDSGEWLWQGDFDLVDACLQLPVVNERDVSN